MSYHVTPYSINVYTAKDNSIRDRYKDFKFVNKTIKWSKLSVMYVGIGTCWCKLVYLGVKRIIISDVFYVK